MPTPSTGIGPGNGEGSKGTQFEKGQSGNPGGMPKGTVKLAARLQAVLNAEDPDAVLDAMPPRAREQVISALDAAQGVRVERIDLEGNVYLEKLRPDATSQKLVWDRHDGLLAQKIEITNPAVFEAIGQAMSELGYSEEQYIAVTDRAALILDPDAFDAPTG